MTEPLLKEMAKDGVKLVRGIIRFAYYMGFIFISLIIIGVLIPEKWLDAGITAVLHFIPLKDEVTTEVYNIVEDFQEESKFIVGSQGIVDSIVVKRVKALCPPATEKAIYRRRADFTYYLNTGEVEVVYRTDTVYFESNPATGKVGYCNYAAPKLTAQQQAILADSLEQTYPLDKNLPREQLEEILSKYIVEEHRKFRSQL